MKGLCLRLRPDAVRLEALRVLGSRNLKGWKVSGLEVLKACPEGPPPPPALNLFGGVAAPRVYRGSKFVWGGGQY